MREEVNENSVSELYTVSVGSDTTMREEVNEDSVSELFIVPAVLVPVLVGNIVVCPAVFIHVVVGNVVLASGIMGGGGGFRMLSGGQVGPAP